VKNELTSVGSTTYASDNNGNLTTETGGSGRPFTYDDENQLTAVGWGSGTYRTEFTYDGRGRMRKRVEKYYTGGQWTVTDTRYYVYDGMRVIQERNNLNTPTVGYTRGNDLSGALEGAGGIGGLLARSDTYSGGSLTRHHLTFTSRGRFSVVVSWARTRR
jgi:YD repeat-containing protein